MTETKTLSEMPKAITMVQTGLELQLGIAPQGTILEVISMRTLKRKMIYDAKGVMDSRGHGIYSVKAPSGYRISRAWNRTVSVETEIAL